MNAASQPTESGVSSEPSDVGRAAGEAECGGGETSAVEAAAAAVRQAKQQLKEARQAYWQIRRHAVERLKEVREMSVGDVVEETLKQVKRYPGPSVIVAALVGFFLGRLFRR